VATSFTAWAMGQSSAGGLGYDHEQNARSLERRNPVARSMAFGSLDRGDRYLADRSNVGNDRFVQLRFPEPTDAGAVRRRGNDHVHLRCGGQPALRSRYSTEPDSDSVTDGQPNQHGHPDAAAERDAHLDPYSNPDPNPYADADSDLHSNADADPDLHADTHSDADPDGHVHLRSDANGDAILHANPEWHGHGVANSNRHGNCQPNTDTNDWGALGS